MLNPAIREKPASRIEELLFQAITEHHDKGEPYYQVVIETNGQRYVYDVLLNIEETGKH